MWMAIHKRIVFQLVGMFKQLAQTTTTSPRPVPLEKQKTSAPTKTKDDESCAYGKR
jgi:hypothetical protein